MTWTGSNSHQPTASGSKYPTSSTSKIFGSSSHTECAVDTEASVEAGHGYNVPVVKSELHVMLDDAVERDTWGRGGGPFTVQCHFCDRVS